MLVLFRQEFLSGPLAGEQWLAVAAGEDELGARVRAAALTGAVITGVDCLLYKVAGKPLALAENSQFVDNLYAAVKVGSLVWVPQEDFDNLLVTVEQLAAAGDLNTLIGKIVAAGWHISIAADQSGNAVGLHNFKTDVLSPTFTGESAYQATWRAWHWLQYGQ